MSDSPTPSEPPQTAPQTIPFNVRGAADAASAEALANVVGAYLRELSRYIDLSGLDGVTLAGDYEQALSELDRGYETSFKLTPSAGDVVGIAMTPTVLRSGAIKSHIVLQIGYASQLEDDTNEYFNLAIHTVTHECAHVEITTRFDKCFPNTLLQKRHDNAHANMRWQVITLDANDIIAGFVGMEDANIHAVFRNAHLRVAARSRPRQHQLRRCPTRR